MVLEEKPPLRRSWLRSQAASLVASGIDFLVTVLLTELAGIWYAEANAVGAFCGAVTSFLLCRHWAFQRNTRQWHYQAMRYTLVSGLSLLLNTAGVVFLTETFAMPYLLSKIITAIFIGLTVNFLLFRYFVFK